MARNHVFSVLLAAGAVLLTACATQPTTAESSASLDEKYFQREANNYMKFQHEGQVVYCQNIPNVASLIPHKYCITEWALRVRVENARRDRNAVAYTKW